MPLYQQQQATATTTWAALPSAAAVGAGTQYRVSDVGLAGGILVVSDGTRWRPDGPQVLSRSWVAVVSPADTLENTVATLTVPAGLMGVSGGIRLTAIWGATSNGNVKTFRAKFGGTTVTSLPISTQQPFRIASEVFNRNAANSQVSMWTEIDGAAQAHANGGAVITSAVDTTAAVTVLITLQKAVGTDAATLEGYVLEVLP